MDDATGLDVGNVLTLEGRMRSALGAMPSRAAEPAFNRSPMHRSDMHRPGGGASKIGGGGGKVPVIVINRRKAPPVAALPAPVASPAAEEALKAERALREKAEQALRDAQQRIRTLQAQMTHAALAHDEILKQERERRIRAEADLHRMPLPAKHVVPSRKQIALSPKAVSPKPAQKQQTFAVPVQPSRPAGKPDSERAAVLRLVLHDAISHDEACKRLGLKPRSLRDLLAVARQNGIDAAATPGRAAKRVRRPVTRAELHSKRATVLPLLHAGKITRWEACERLGIKPRGLRKLLGAQASAVSI